MNPPEIITTARLILRKPRMDDAPVIFESYARDPEVTRYLVWKPHKNIQETEQFLSACEQLWRTGKDFAYAITLKENDTLVGMFGLHPMNLKLEVGYALARPYWGKGYMTEVLRDVIAWAITQAGHLPRAGHLRCREHRLRICDGKSGHDAGRIVAAVCPASQHQR